MLFCSARSAVSRRTRGRGLPACAQRGDRADLDGAEAERAQALEPARVLVDAGRDPERAREAQPERLDGERRVRAAEHPQQPEPVRQRHAAGGERVGGPRAGCAAGRARRAGGRARCHHTARPDAATGAVGAVRVDVVDRRERLVRRVARREPDRLRAAGEPVQHGDHAADVEALGADGLDRLHGRAARGDDVLDDQAALALLERRALDAALEAVLLDLLAHEERLHVRAAGERGAGRRVGAHRQPADRGRLPLAGVAGDELGQRGEAGGAQDGALGVDVVLRRGAGGERHLADQQRVRAQLGDERLPGGGHRAPILGAAPAVPATLTLPRRWTTPSAAGSRSPSAWRRSCCSSTRTTLALDHRASEILPRLGDAAKPDVYEAAGRDRLAGLARRAARPSPRSAPSATACATPARR